MTIKHRAFSMVKESISSTGTGNITLSGAITGYDTFASRLSDQDECYVFITLEDGNFNGDAHDWELSKCVFTISGTILTRTVLESSNGDAAITVSTSHVAYICFSAKIGDALDIFGTADGSLSFGPGAGGTQVTGIDNIFIGKNAGNSMTSGQENTFIGKDSGDVCTGTTNTFIGKDAGKGATTTDDCVAVGKDAMGGSATHTGNRNCVMGFQSGDALTSGESNNFMGWNAGGSVANGTRNVIIGAESYGASGLDYNVHIGYRNSSSNDNCLLFGYRITSTGTNQCVFGNEAYTQGRITDFYFNGIKATSPEAVILQPQGGDGTNIVGGAMQLSGGKSTGNAVGGDIEFHTSDAGASGTTLQSGTKKGYVDGADGGMVWGTPTGGSQGAGTINAVGVYDDSTLLTDYVFEIYYNGEAVDKGFEAYKIKSLEDEIAFVKEHKHLSTIIGRKEWEAEGKISQGKLISQLWATVETQHLYIAELDARLKKLGG